MKKRIRLALVLAILGCFLMGNTTIMASENAVVELPENKIEIIPDIGASVESRSNPSLSGCTLGIGVADNGVSLTFITRATQTANEIGVKDIVLQEKTWYGWKDISINSYCSYNSDTYVGEIVYTGAEKGKTYRANCTHYAKFGNTEIVLSNTTDTLVYN